MSESAAGDDLIELGGAVPLGLYLSELWDRREFAIVVPANDIRAQNMDTALGQLWHLVNPLMLVGVYYLIFGVVLEADRGVQNYLAFLVCGILLFQLTQRVVQDSAAAINRNEGLIRSLQFPRALLPVSAVVGQTLAFLPALLVLLVVTVATGELPTWRWLVLPGVLALQCLIGLGAAFITARVGFALRDIEQILPHLFRLVFYLSGVLFAVEAFVSRPLYQHLFALNPLYDVISVARWCLLGRDVSGYVITGLLAWAVLLPVGGLLFFRAAEHRYGS